MSRTRFRVNLHSIITLELLARNRHDIWSLSDNNAIRINNHLVRKRTLNHLESFGFKTHYCHSLGVFDHLVRSVLEELASSVSEISIVIIDREHEFYDVIKHIHEKACSKLDAFTVMTNIMAHQNNALFKFFVKGQFNHSPPVRMFSWHSSSYSINKIHEVILPLTTEINYISFKKLLFLKIITKTYKHCK